MSPGHVAVLVVAVAVAAYILGLLTGLLVDSIKGSAVG